MLVLLNMVKMRLLQNVTEEKLMVPVFDVAQLFFSFDIQFLKYYHCFCHEMPFQMIHNL